MKNTIDCLGLQTGTPVADPGFPVGDVDPLGEAWTSDTGAFHQKCMQKSKNWVP